MKNEDHKDSELVFLKNVKMFLCRYLTYCQFGLIRCKESEEMIGLKKIRNRKIIRIFVQHS